MIIDQKDYQGTQSIQRRRPRPKNSVLKAKAPTKNLKLANKTRKGEEKVKSLLKAFSGSK